ncbi:hypothetical protein [Tenacibaculum sp. Ill]|uniref:hypothetical protein n=1 Tax=Tenacibaculum sp. Ill TaxID=3445935 RepID=UPI003F7A708F
MKEKIENITKFIPIIYPIAIFLGYYNYYIYYGFFNIEIFHYLNISELLFSFVSMVIPLFITLFLGLCYMIFIAILPRDDSDKTNKEKSFDDSHLTPAEKRLRRIQSNKKVNINLIFNESHQKSLRSLILFLHKLRKGSCRRAFAHFSELLSFFISLLIKILLWLFFVVFSSIIFDLLFSPFDGAFKEYRPFLTSGVSTILCLIIWISIVYTIIYRFSNKRVINFIHVILLIMTVLFSLTYYQKTLIEKTIHHETSDVKFNYKNKPIESHSELVFLGKTSDFIFLRDLKQETNFIFPIKDITHLEIKKLRKEDEKICKEEK